MEVLSGQGKIESMYRSGTAPITISLPADKYKLSVRKEGFETYTNDFQIQAGKKQTIDVAMNKATGATAGLSSSVSDGTGRQDCNSRDREAAQWVLSVGGKVRVGVGGQERDVPDASQLPKEAFRVVRVDLRDIKAINDETLANVSDLTACRYLEP